MTIDEHERKKAEEEERKKAKEKELRRNILYFDEGIEIGIERAEKRMRGKRILYSRIPSRTFCM